MDELLTQAAEEMEQPEEETSAAELLEETGAPQKETGDAPEEKTEKTPPGEDEEAPDEEAVIAEYKKGLATLQEDGWTKEELLRFSKDAQVQKNIKGGMTIRQAARAYLIAAKAEEAPKKRRGVPTSRPTALGAAEESSVIENMTDKEFAEFSRRAERAMMEGKKVRFD